MNMQAFAIQLSCNEEFQSRTLQDEYMQAFAMILRMLLKEKQPALLSPMVTPAHPVVFVDCPFSRGNLRKSRDIMAESACMRLSPYRRKRLQISTLNPQTG